MSREQIRVRINSEQWESWRQEGEGNSELLSRILEDWQQLRQTLATLTELDPVNPSQALGRLLASHELLSSAAVTIQPSAAPSADSPLAAPPHSTVESDSLAAETIDGLENNGDDW